MDTYGYMDGAHRVGQVSSTDHITRQRQLQRPTPYCQVPRFFLYYLSLMQVICRPYAQ